MKDIKYPLLLIGKSGISRNFFSSSEWSVTTCLRYNYLQNVLSVSLNQTFPFIKCSIGCGFLVCFFRSFLFCSVFHYMGFFVGFL